jgi:hypothetical protein
MWCATCGKDSATPECPTCEQWWKDNPPTVADLLAAHAQFGQMDKAMTKAAMGKNWPPEFDDLPEGPGSIFHAKQPD